jgi:protoporphyrinogen oxidase
MQIGIVGGGILGLSLAHYLQRAGHRVDIFERSAYLGGLARSFNYGEFIWDRFYHVLLPQDIHLIELLGELGLAGDLRWRSTRTGYCAGGRLYSMSNSQEMLRFPLLSWIDKLRMGLGTLYAVRLANRDDLYRMTAAEWLAKVFGRSNYETFWRPLLRAKFGEYTDRVAALSIQTTLARLFCARSAVANREAMGYVHGGYHRILAVFRAKLESAGVSIQLGARVNRIGMGHEWEREVPERLVVGGHGAVVVDRPPGVYTGSAAALDQVPAGACGIEYAVGTESPKTAWYDHVIFTAPASAALSVVGASIRHAVESEMQSEIPSRYLGIVCLNVVLKRPLTPFYVLNIADEMIPLTGVIEVTSLIDGAEEINGRTLVYLPRYVDSGDPFLRAEDAEVFEELFNRGLRRVFPDLDPGNVVSWHVQRAPFVQPLRLAGPNVPPPGNRRPIVCESFTLANTALLECPTLNNNEVVGLAKEVAALVSA